MTKPVNPRVIALTVACSMFMGQLDSTIVTTALPQMARSFATTPVNLSITITVYLLVQAVFLPASGWISDRFGARSVFASAIAIFTIASMLCGFSHTLWVFLAARILQALAAALMTPVGRVVLLRSTEKRDLLRMMNISTISMLVAPTIGPPLGGFVTSFYGWSWVFFLNVPMGVAGVWLVFRYIPNIPGHKHVPFDFIGFFLMAVSLSLLLSGLDRLGSAGADWSWPITAIIAGFGVGFLAVWHARRTAHPLVPLTALDIPTFRITSLGGGSLARLPVRAIPFIFPLMFQVTLGMSAFRSGLLLLALSAGDLMLKLATPHMFSRIGFRRALIGSALLMTVTVLSSAGFGLSTPDWLIFGLLTLCGMFRSVLFTGMSTLVYADIAPAHVSDATVLWNLTQQVTNALAISVAAILMTLGAWARHGSPEHLTLFDCRFTLCCMAAFGLFSALSFLRLRPDAGAEISGHAPGASAG